MKIHEKSISKVFVAIVHPSKAGFEAASCHLGSCVKEFCFKF